MLSLDSGIFWEVTGARVSMIPLIEVSLGANLRKLPFSVKSPLANFSIRSALVSMDVDFTPSVQFFGFFFGTRVPFWGRAA